MKKLYLSVILIAGILIGMSAYHYLTRLGPGDIAPNFELEDIAGSRHSLNGYKGSVVLLHIWATWCPTCIAELPGLEKISQKYKDKGLKVISVLVDEKNTESALQAVKLRVPINFDVLLDPTGKLSSIYDSFSVPESFFIDREGKVLRRISGAADWGSELSYIDNLLEK